MVSFFFLLIVLIQAPLFYKAGFWVYDYSERYNRAIQIGLITGFGLAFIASIFIPIYMLIARWTESVAPLLPTFIYYNTDLLIFTPVMLCVVGFLLGWSFATLTQEIKTQTWQTSLAAIGILILAGTLIFFWLSHYRLLSKYANNPYLATTNNQNFLIDAYNHTYNTTDPRLLQALALIAKNNNAPADLLRNIYQRSLTADTRLREVIFFNLADNTQTPYDILKLVAPSRQSSIYSATFASNPSAEKSATKQLLTSSNCEIRRQIILNPNTTIDTLKWIVKNDPDMSIRQDADQQLKYLQHTPSPPIPTYGILANEVKLHKQLESTASNSTDPTELTSVLNEIDKHKNFFPLLEILAHNCNITNQMTQDIYSKTQKLSDAYYKNAILTALAMNPNTSPDVLKQLANEKDPKLLRYLVGNPNLPQDTMSKFLNYPDCVLRKSIITNNPNVPMAILNQMKTDPDESVSTAATTRINQPIDYQVNALKTLINILPSCEAKYSPNVEQMYKGYQGTFSTSPKNQ